MNRCKKCAMPDTRPGLMFNDQGVCLACVRHQIRAFIDWGKRINELIALANDIKARAGDDEYNCVIAVSGGKDSHTQVKVLKEDFGLRPLLVTVNNLPNDWTSTGRHNAANLIERFDCERIGLDLSPAACRRAFRYCFEKFGTPTWYWDRAVYTFPMQIAAALGISAVFYGENISWEYGGPEAEDTPCANDQQLNNVACEHDTDTLIDMGLSVVQRAMTRLSVDYSFVDSYYLSYYIPWSGTRNVTTAKAYGFRELDLYESRAGYIEQYDQIDAIAYLVHCWMKYPKYGHARATDIASLWVREGHISRDRAMQLVEENDHILDSRIKGAFCRFCGYTPEEFDAIVHLHTKEEYLDKTVEGLKGGTGYAEFA